MPTYQYSCTDCGHQLEVVQSFTDDSLTECPQCQGRLRKVFNAVGVVFKGSGFYRTDSRSKSSATDTPASSAPTSSSSDGASSGSASSAPSTTPSSTKSSTPGTTSSSTAS